MKAEDSGCGGGEKNDNIEALITKTEKAIASAEQRRIDLLHQYNDCKDATQVILGVLAQKEGVSIRQLHQRFELPLKDA